MVESDREPADPYRTFRVRVVMDGRAVAGFSKITALKRVAEEAARTQPHFGRTQFEAIKLERGLTHDVEFEAWASAAWKGGAGIDPRRVVTKSRRDLVIEVRNEAGALTIRYQVVRCWVSAIQGLPKLDDPSNAVAIESMKIENEGWQREEIRV